MTTCHSHLSLFWRKLRQVGNRTVLTENIIATHRSIVKICNAVKKDYNHVVTTLHTALQKLILWYINDFGWLNFLDLDLDPDPDPDSDPDPDPDPEPDPACDLVQEPDPRGCKVG